MNLRTVLLPACPPAPLPLHAAALTCAMRSAYVAGRGEFGASRQPLVAITRCTTSDGYVSPAACMQRLRRVGAAGGAAVPVYARLYDPAIIPGLLRCVQVPVGAPGLLLCRSGQQDQRQRQEPGAQSHLHAPGQLPKSSSYQVAVYLHPRRHPNSSHAVYVSCIACKACED